MIQQAEIGDIVYWTFDCEVKKDRKPIPFNNAGLWIGIVTRKAVHGDGIEVFWFNNGIFKTMNQDGLLLASNFSVKEVKNQ